MPPTSRVVSLVLSLLGLGALGCDDGPASTADGGSFVCTEDRDCSDGLFCNGDESCNPSAPGANPSGCLAGTPPCTDMCDEVADTCLTDCEDADGDGVPDIACGGSDCDDGDANVFPGAAEVCDDAGVDEDCDPLTVGERDADGDGFAPAECCNGERCGLDCDDDDDAVKPGQVEVCNDTDDDCDGSIDEGVRAEAWPDADRDGWGDADGTPETVCVVPSGAATRGGDCNDANPFQNPGAVDSCNGLDDDCDGVLDESGDTACAVELAGTAAGGYCYAAGTEGASCRYQECLSGQSDCNGDYRDGCEIDVCRASLSCNFCGRTCSDRCSGGVCSADMVVPPGFALAFFDDDGGIEGVVVTDYETCTDVTDTSNASGIATLDPEGAPLGPDLLIEEPDHLPGFGGNRYTRAEIDAWLTEIGQSWDDRTGIVIIRHDATVWDAPVYLYPDLAVEPDPPVEQPSNPPFVVAEDGSLNLGRSVTPGRIVFVNVPAGHVRMAYDAPMCTIACASNQSFPVRGGTVTEVFLGSCGDVQCS